MIFLRVKNYGMRKNIPPEPEELLNYLIGYRSYDMNYSDNRGCRIRKQK